MQCDAMWESHPCSLYAPHLRCQCPSRVGSSMRGHWARRLVSCGAIQNKSSMSSRKLAPRLKPEKRNVEELNSRAG